MALFGISLTMWIVFGLGFAFYVLIYVLSIALYGKRPGRNPFILPSLLEKRPERTPADVTTDQSIRDAVLKQHFTPTRIPDRIDAIVIGSGIGGLTAAALLARARKRVLVLEKHGVLGGCCHTFAHKGYEFDVGIHYIGEMRPGSFLRCLTDQITDGKLMWQPLDYDFDRVVVGDREVLVPADRAEFARRLAEAYPEDAAGVSKFFGLLNQLRRGSKLYWGLKLIPLPLAKLIAWSGLCHLFSAYFRHLNTSLKQCLDSCISSNSLKTTLSYCFGDYGTPPGEASVVMHAVLLNHFLRQGGFYPVGGASEIAFSCVPVVEKAGGRALVKAPVTEIICNAVGRAVGVKVRAPDGDMIAVLAPLIVSDAGLVNTGNLLPTAVLEKSRIPRLLTRVHSGRGALSVFIGLRLPPSMPCTSELLDPIRGRNLWLLNQDDGDKDLQAALEAYTALDAQEAFATDPPLLFCSFPSLKDPTWARRRGADRLTCAIVTFGNWEWFEPWQEAKKGKRGQEYDGIKTAMGRRMWERVKDKVPVLADCELELLDVGTPLTNRHYINSSRGEIYGLDHSVERMSPDVCAQLRPDIGVPGLLLAGQDVAICGFVGAMIGGLLCTSVALNRNLIADLGKLIKADARGVLRRERMKAE